MQSSMLITPLEKTVVQHEPSECLSQSLKQSTFQAFIQF